MVCGGITRLVIDNRDPVWTFRATEAVREATAEQEERLRGLAPAGVKISRADAISTLILAGGLAYAAADDEALKYGSPYAVHSPRDIILAGLHALTAKAAAAKGNRL